MIVDSGVWIDHFLDRASPAVSMLRETLSAGRQVFLTASILQEVLQGTRDAAQFDRYSRLLAGVAIVRVPNEREVAVLAARLCARLRWKGITVPPQDCEIAARAIFSGEPLLSADGDFHAIAEREPRLWLAQG